MTAREISSTKFSTKKRRKKPRRKIKNEFGTRANISKNLEELLQIEAIRINAGNVSFIMHANEYSVEHVAGHHYSVKLDNLYIAEFESDNVVVDAPDEFKELASVEESKFSENFGNFILSAVKPSNKNVEIILREDCELLDNDFKICFAW